MRNPNDNPNDISNQKVKRSINFINENEDTFHETNARKTTITPLKRVAKHIKVIDDTLNITELKKSTNAKLQKSSKDNLKKSTTNAKIDIDLIDYESNNANDLVCLTQTSILTSLIMILILLAVIGFVLIYNCIQNSRQKRVYLQSILALQRQQTSKFYLSHG